MVDDKPKAPPVSPLTRTVTGGRWERRVLRALVVDDELDDRIAMRRALVQAGFEVEEAENGRRAIDKIHERDYDMIVVDILMPQVDGYELLNYLKKKDPTVLARTVVASRIDLRDMKVFFPLCQVLQKPIDAESLGVIARIMRNAADA